MPTNPAPGDDPSPNGCNKIAGYDNLYHVRVDDWRITYAIYEGLLLIVIIAVKPRGRAYRTIWPPKRRKTSPTIAAGEKSRRIRGAHQSSAPR